MSQNANVLDWLRRKRSITSWEAIDHLQISRLAARINDLTKKGHEIINTEPNGKLARYVLIKEAGA